MSGFCVNIGDFTPNPDSRCLLLVLSQCKILYLFVMWSPPIKFSPLPGFWPGTTPVASCRANHWAMMTLFHLFLASNFFLLAYQFRSHQFQKVNSKKIVFKRKKKEKRNNGCERERERERERKREAQKDLLMLLSGSKE